MSNSNVSGGERNISDAFLSTHKPESYDCPALLCSGCTSRHWIFPPVFYSGPTLRTVADGKTCDMVGGPRNAQPQITDHTPLVVSERLFCVFL
jgi:hypothetical protein